MRNLEGACHGNVLYLDSGSDHVHRWSHWVTQYIIKICITLDGINQY